MKKIELTKNEVRALKILLVDGRACNASCAYEEMQDSAWGCTRCEYYNAIHSILEKLE